MRETETEMESVEERVEEENILVCSTVWVIEQYATELYMLR